MKLIEDLDRHSVEPYIDVSGVLGISCSDEDTAEYFMNLLDENQKLKEKFIKEGISHYPELKCYFEERAAIKNPNKPGAVSQDELEDEISIFLRNN